MRLKSYCGIGLVVYALLSAADLLLTVSLLQVNGEAYEANPAAAACLEQHGWNGLAVFKAGGVLLFFGAVFLLVRRKPKVAAGVVTLGCGVLLAVTLYSHGLLREAHAEEAQREALRGNPGISPDWHFPERCRPPTPGVPSAQ